MAKQKKNVLIYGVSRSGKTTLAKMLNKKLHYNIVVLDDLVAGLGSAFAELGINFRRNLKNEKAVKNCETKLNRFLVDYLYILEKEKNARSPLNFCVEGVYFNFNTLAKHVDLSNYVIVALGYPKLSENEIAHFMKKFDTAHDWSFNLSEEERLEKAGYYAKESKEALKTAQKHGFAFFDVSFSRKKVLKQAFKYIKSKI